MERNIKDYLPLYVQEYREIKEIMNTEQESISLLWDCSEKALSDQYVQTATDYGLSRLENMLGIIPKSDDTLDERRFNLMIALNEQLPYSEKVIREQLKGFCGENDYTMIVDHNNYTITVKIALESKKKYEYICDYLRRVAPANMVITVLIMYVTYGELSAYKHSKLANYTHQQLHDERIQVS